MKFADEVTILVDFDTCLVRSATSCQHDYQVFKDGEFLESASSMKNWKEKNPDVDLSKVEFKLDPVLKEVEEGADIFWRAMYGVKQEKARVIKLHKEMKELQGKKLNFIFYVQGDGNYRNDIYPEYKQNRTTPVLLRKRLVQYAVQKQGCKLVENEETDDHVSIHCFNAYRKAQRTGEYDVIVSHVDKDINGVAGAHSNYDKGTLYEITPEEGFQFFCWQLLVGDSTDNIKGLNKPIPENSFWWDELEQYHGKSLRRSIGGGTATTLLAEYLDPKDCLKLVTEAYMEAHGVNWLEALQEEAIALRMRHTPNEMYDISKTLERFDLL